MNGKILYRLLMIALLFFSLCGGCVAPKGKEYRAMYSHLSDIPSSKVPMKETPYFLVLLVEARHLDYTNNYTFFKTMMKHPSDWSKNRDVGHAWIYLQGIIDGESVYLEGGHSGERGICQARYFEGIMNNIDYGCANPTKEQCCNPGYYYEPNPVKYLWEIQKDGYFQQGSGRHRATYAAKIDLTEEQFHEIWEFIRRYRFCDYALTGQQCSSFLTQVAALGGLELECEVSMPIEQVLVVNGQPLRMWEDPAYSILTVSTPDILERSLMEAVREGRAEYALDWFNQ